MVIVIGVAHSNTRAGADCSRYCQRVHHVQSEDLRIEWIKDADTIGITQEFRP